MRIKKIISGGEMIPIGYGISYYEVWADRSVCYPIPINIIISLARRVWIWFMWRHGLSRDDYAHYLWIRSQVAEVYCEITGGTLSYADYPASAVLNYFEQYNLSKSITEDDVKMFIDRCKTLKELQDELIIYFEIDMRVK